MKKAIFFCFSLILILINSIPMTANAYSYGDPNEEKVAEVHKEMVLKLDEDPPNFSAATSLFETVKEEIDMHMGTEPGEVIMKSLAEEDKEATIENMEKLLVLNVARRLESIEKSFDQFDTSKKLLAKGYATYQALSSKVEASNPEADKEIKADFDAALEALGNPGLFGVGKKPSDIKIFKEKKEEILKALQDEFDLPNLEVGHFTDTEEQEGTGKKDWTDRSNIRNWIPLILIVAVIGALVFIGIKRRK
ncbi:hypothetical protein LC048_04090 [Mesobacillus subterraneus]|uniref:hypothetical protein n=1 Tax=Mesobacillus subterraneus TaxID=285983 RepID=UPI001CFC7E43|nr:hypothetical protein [Mesobacillus subterraneus]WLR56137.1 hypothetical protein LC048_04090 [Mesobacillus subterraneus]